MSTWLLIVFLCVPHSAPCQLYPVLIEPLTEIECEQMRSTYAQDANYRGGRCIKQTAI